MVNMKSNYLKHMFVACLSGFTLTLAAQPTAKEWNKDVVGWNLGNQTFIDVVRATGGNNLKRHLIVQLQKENQNN